MRFPPFIERDFPFPRFHRVRLRRAASAIESLADELTEPVDRALADSGVRTGHRVAVGVGSRGIDRLPELVALVCGRIREIGAEPFVVPAMGSHGGATPEGQASVLEHLGVTEDSAGAPAVSSLEVRQVGTVRDDVPVWFSADALDADHSICINRIKPHTKFKAELESGLFKMLCVGMGKHEGALAFHDHALLHGFAPLLREMGAALLSETNFRFGLAVVENEQDRICHAEPVMADRMAEREAELLEMAKERFPGLPVKEADLLVIGRIGKEISGSGMDPNVTGRAFDLKESDFSKVFHATRVVLLRLSQKTAGNAIGLGNADIVTERMFQEMDYEATLINALTSRSLHKAFIPIRMPTEEKAIQAGFTTLGPISPEKVRAILIRDTMHLDEIWVSEALAEEISKVEGASVEAPIAPRFDADGNLVEPSLFSGS
ncbi:MAG: lactate racemase domain-containing protein [Desulfococcaceae bacterium]